MLLSRDSPDCSLALPELLTPALRSPRGTAVAATAAAIGGVTWFHCCASRGPAPKTSNACAARNSPSRTHHATAASPEKSLPKSNGHIHYMADIEETHVTPQLIVYNYRIAGVAYEAAQDVTTLSDLVRDVRTDLPIQVRYEPHNPRQQHHQPPRTVWQPAPLRRHCGRDWESTATWKRAATTPAMATESLRKDSCCTFEFVVDKSQP